MKITFDSQSILIDGRREFLVSGEFHYFRVPPEDWRRRMELLKEAGGNCLATYVPWLIHEPEEGRIVFGNQPKRDFARFLETARDAGLAVIARPGPYQYSELADSGLPGWLLKNYPSLRAKKVDGSDLAESSVSYMHPLFLEKARRYYRAFAEVVRPYLAANGGPVALLQHDNELTGIHVRFGGPDYTPETFGFGTDDGRYPSFLREKYGDIAVLNKAYGTAWDSFAEARPLTDAKPVEKARSDRDKWVNNTRLNDLNAHLEAMQDGKTVFYIETNSLFDNADGDMDTTYTHDNVHILGKYYTVWGEYIKAHAIIGSSSEE